jgi:hypothetical protein
MVALILAIFGISEKLIEHPAALSYSESSYWPGYFPAAALSPEQSAAKELELHTTAEKENTSVKINFLTIFIPPIRNYLYLKSLYLM